jgi:hypothetical protein
MKKIILNSLMAVMFLITLSCSESFLNENPKGVLSLEVLSTPSGVEANLISAYSVLDGFFEQGGDAWPTAGSNWIFGDIASDDSYKGSENGDQPIMTQIELYQWDPVSPYFDQKFRAVYEGVSRANATLTLMRSAEGMAPADTLRISAEARFLRAHYHFDAYKFWKNIPYYTEADAVFTKKNDVNVIPLIVADLEYAVANLPATQGDAGRATKATAQAYLGKVLLWDEDYAGAKAQFDAVMGDSNYSLNPCFYDNFNSDNDANNPESLLAYQASINDGDANGGNANHPDRLAFPHSGSPFGCCGFKQPTQNLVNNFKVDASGLPIANFNAADLDRITDFVDPRLDWTAGRDDVPYLDWGNHEPAWIRDRGYSGPYSPKKGAYQQAQGSHNTGGWQGTQLGATNHYIIRLADVILMLAECEVEVGTLARATELVNMIRTRAGNCAQGASAIVQTDINASEITWANYNIGTYPTFASPTAATNAIRLERRLELALEGHRLFDLRRWGIAADVLNTYIAEEKSKRVYLDAAETFGPKHALYPLPQIQIELSSVDGVPQLEQNPNW